jgi:hypothetical protein
MMAPTNAAPMKSDFIFSPAPTALNGNAFRPERLNELNFLRDTTRPKILLVRHVSGRLPILKLQKKYRGAQRRQRRASKRYR